MHVSEISEVNSYKQQQQEQKIYFIRNSNTEILLIPSKILSLISPMKDI